MWCWASIQILFRFILLCNWTICLYSLSNINIKNASWWSIQWLKFHRKLHRLQHEKSKISIAHHPHLRKWKSIPIDNFIKWTRRQPGLHIKLIIFPILTKLSREFNDVRDRICFFTFFNIENVISRAYIGKCNFSREIRKMWLFYASCRGLNKYYISR